MSLHTTQSSASTLRSLLSDRTGEPLIVPGVHNGLTARQAHSAGFEALYLPSGGVALELGIPGLGLVTATEMASSARMLSRLNRDLPLIVDADNGYGPPLNVARTVEMYIDAGAAAITINDKLLDQRKGFVDGKNLCSKEEFVTRIRAAVMMREKTGSDILIVAESYAARYISVEDAVVRFSAAVELGADGVFPSGMTNRDQCEAFGKAFGGSKRAFLVCSMVSSLRDGFKMTAADAKAMGYSVVLFASVCVSSAFLATKTALENLKATGQLGEIPPEASARQTFETCGMGELLQFDKDIGSGGMS